MDIISKNFLYFCQNIIFKLLRMSKKNDEDKAPKLMDFVATQKVDAFCRQYQPVSKQDYNTEVYNEIRLRNFFKADVCPCGDPLTIYLSLLEKEGFEMSVSLQDEPVLLVKERYDPSSWHPSYRDCD